MSEEIIEKVINNITVGLREELKKVENQLVETDGNKFLIDLFGKKEDKDA